MSPVDVTVGDTVFVQGVWSAPAGSVVRTGSVESSQFVEVLLAPVSERNGSTVTVRYAVALFRVGDINISTPSIEFIDPGGTVSPVESGVTGVAVRSVLPPADSAPELRPGFDPIRRPVTRIEPLVYLVVASSVLAFVFWAVWNRSPLPRPETEQNAVQPLADLDAWASAGEATTVAELGRQRLVRLLASRFDEVERSSTTPEITDRLNQHSTEIPYREIESLLHRLDRVAFAPTHGASVDDLVAEVDELVVELSAPADAASVGEENVQ